MLPQRFTDVANAGDGAEVRLTGRRSTAWASGGDTPPPPLVPDIEAAFGRREGRSREVIEGVRLGQETGEDELVTLFSARGPEVAAVAALADELRAAGDGRHGHLRAHAQHQLHEPVHVQVPRSARSPRGR